MGTDGLVQRYKARLIFQHKGDGGDDKKDIYAPVVDKNSLRLFPSGGGGKKRLFFRTIRC